MIDFRYKVFLAISSLTLVMAAPVLGQSHTVPGHTLQDVAGFTDPNVMNEEWQTPLMAASSNADDQAVKALIERKANVNVGDRFGMTALMYARGTAVVKSLLDAGALVKDKDIRGRTALYFAAQRADPGVVEALIKAGANVNAKDDKGMSPLKIAELNLCCTNFSDKQLRDVYRDRIQRIINLLIKAGALPEPLDTTDEQGLEPEPEPARLSGDGSLIDDSRSDDCARTAQMDVYSDAQVSREAGDLSGFELGLDKPNGSHRRALLFVYEGGGSEGIPLTAIAQGSNRLIIEGTWVEHLTEYPSKKEIVQTHRVRIAGKFTPRIFRGTISIEGLGIANPENMQLKRVKRIWVCNTHQSR
jgi:Ankyrin repeats (3 copies)/Ankyrin repeat